MHGISCPTCDYKYGLAGQPRMNANGSMTCKVCNSQWRELNGPNIDHSEVRISSQPDLICESSIRSTSNILSSDFMQKRPGFSLGFWPGSSPAFSLSFVSISVGIIITLLVATTVWRSQELPSKYSTQLDKFNALILDNIKVEQRINNHARFWEITARVSNHSAHSINVPSIVMKSGVKGSSGYFDRTYRPALQKLAPGSNLIIRTSVHQPKGSNKDIQLEFASGHPESG
jgi:hypothetical protein